ncbi:ATP synthase F1 subunit gamma [bacterium]|nr:ATP synthase F1 subunit gamma [bacterium]|tara:strand:- start:6489 stop:7400 length:912 start_codon:yes stop_codon:yes gene_type:complete
MSNLKDITTRIHSIQNIHKITKAMELVSISKMKRATSAVLASRDYAGTLWAVIDDLAGRVNQKAHPLLFSPKKIKKVLLIVMTSDRGLCGSFNTEIFQKVSQFLKILGEKRKVDYVVIGKKGEDRAAREKWNVLASFDNLSVAPNFNDAAPIARLATDEFLNKKYDHVFIIYSDFVSTINQRSVIHELLPIKSSEDLGDVESNLKKKEKEDLPKYSYEFKFEPGRDEVLEFILPRAIQTQVYQALLESIASEQAARMVAMKNASDAAVDMVDDLKLTFNQLRQAAITREIAEISTGKAVLEEV